MRVSRERTPVVLYATSGRNVSRTRSRNGAPLRWTVTGPNSSGRSAWNRMPPPSAEISASPEGRGPCSVNPSASGKSFSNSSGTNVARNRSFESVLGATRKSDSPTAKGCRLVPLRYERPSGSLQSNPADSSRSALLAPSNDPAAWNSKSPRFPTRVVSEGANARRFARNVASAAGRVGAHATTVLQRFQGVRNAIGFSSARSRSLEYDQE